MRIHSQERNQDTGQPPPREINQSQCNGEEEELNKCLKKWPKISPPSSSFPLLFALFFLFFFLYLRNRKRERLKLTQKRKNNNNSELCFPVVRVPWPEPPLMKSWQVGQETERLTRLGVSASLSGSISYHVMSYRKCERPKRRPENRDRMPCFPNFPFAPWLRVGKRRALSGWLSVLLL